VYKWSTRQVIRAVRQAAKANLSSAKSRAATDSSGNTNLTTLEVGKFKEFKHLIRVYNGKRGLHVVLLYLVVEDGECLGFSRLPWVGYPSPSELGLRLVKSLPKP